MSSQKAYADSFNSSFNSNGDRFYDEDGLVESSSNESDQSSKVYKDIQHAFSNDSYKYYRSSSHDSSSRSSKFSKVCFNCCKYGHISRNCDLPINVDLVSFYGKCSMCGMFGHRKSDCFKNTHRDEDWDKEANIVSNTFVPMHPDAQFEDCLVDLTKDTHHLKIFSAHQFNLVSNLIETQYYFEKNIKKTKEFNKKKRKNFNESNKNAIKRDSSSQFDDL